jgi:hypothetical protein
VPSILVISDNQVSPESNRNLCECCAACDVYRLRKRSNRQGNGVYCGDCSPSGTVALYVVMPS